MKRKVRYIRMATSLLLILMIMPASACFNTSPATPSSATPAKASSLLLRQISLRQAQLTSPSPQRLAQMQSLGMDTRNLNIQRIYIYLNQQLDSAQTAELQALGLILYLDSWLPPVGQHPTGFILADLPVDKLVALDSKDYVIRLDTAETQLKPQLIKP
jgi:hypothetical protein